MYDIVIIGGGPAGLTAAVYASRAGKKVLVTEGNAYGGQITASHKVANYPGIAEIGGMEFADKLTEQAVSFGAETEFDEAAEIVPASGGFTVVGQSGKYDCKSVILATGVTARKLGVPGEEKFTGAGVSYCAVCDGAFFKGKDVAVIGGGNTAVSDAEFLSGYCNKVYIVHRRDKFRADEKDVERLERRANVEKVMNSVAVEIVGDNAARGVRIKNVANGEESELSVAGVFVAVGHIPKNGAFKDLVRLDADGFIAAGEDCKTSAPGIFVAGDCRTKQIRQLTTAAADGAVAALAACKFIDSES